MECCQPTVFLHNHILSIPETYPEQGILLHG